MPPKRFDNYIRMLRKQKGLSQDELAFLLGWKSGSAVSRLEQDRRKPSLETLLAMEAIFGIPIRELYAGKFQKVESAVKERVTLFISAHEENLSVRKRLRDLLAAIYSRETPPTTW
ncbi:MAG TPA: helix-turn-helix transcriptional regulator [Thermoanaerobaculia bacterium]|nr:helix-turn-helix transcriptional regulator [Thermoanaerobaculia bacterium]